VRRHANRIYHDYLEFIIEYDYHNQLDHVIDNFKHDNHDNDAMRWILHLQLDWR